MQRSSRRHFSSFSSRIVVRLSAGLIPAVFFLMTPASPAASATRAPGAGTEATSGTTIASAGRAEPAKTPLPIGMSPEEETRKAEIGTYGPLDTPPPSGPGIRQCAEWEPITGALVEYSSSNTFGVPYGILQDMANSVELWVLVASQAQQNTCYAALQSNGVNMNHVHFVQTATDSWWTRDYGPQFVFDADGNQGIVDHHYNRPRPHDDQVNYVVGAAWNIPVYGTPLIHTGGNYMCDGHNNAFSTDLVWNENTNYTHDQIAALMRSYLGITNYHVFPDIDPSGIHHVDCWAKLLDERTLLVKQVANTNPDYAQIEADVATFATYTNAYGKPYKIVRVFCGSLGGNSVASYTNSYIINNRIYVPIFNISSDAAALQTYRDAMPGYTVEGFAGSWLSDDAIHCRIMGIHDKYMLRVDVAPLPDTLSATGDVPLYALVDDRSGAGLKSDSLLVYWRLAGDVNFQSTALTAAAGVDSFYAAIPGQPAGSHVQYYVFAADQSNRRSVRPPSAPAGFYSYFVSGSNSGLAAFARESDFGLSANGPNPFHDHTVLSFRLPETGPVRLSVIDVQGRLAATLVQGTLPPGGHNAVWDGRLTSGAEAADGIYFFRLNAGTREEVRRGVLIRK